MFMHMHVIGGELLEAEMLMGRNVALFAMEGHASCVLACSMPKQLWQMFDRGCKTRSQARRSPYALLFVIMVIGTISMTRKFRAGIKGVEEEIHGYQVNKPLVRSDGDIEETIGYPADILKENQRFE
jgi:hypothetical protein